MTPNRQLSFLICGAQKSGTTSLFNYLRQHPDLYLPDDKELHLFDNESRDWSYQGINKIDEEIGIHFKKALPGQICGEATPVSLFWDPAAERIWRYNPKIKLVAILRNPITRAYSQWNMEIQRGREKAEFNTSLLFEEERCRESLPLQHRVYSYLDRGFYTFQLRRMWRFFSRKQFLILKQEQLLNDPITTLELIYNHIGVKNIPFKSQQKSHTRDYNCSMPKESRLALKEIYKNEIKELEQLLKWDCSNWLMD